MYKQEYKKSVLIMSVILILIGLFFYWSNSSETIVMYAKEPPVTAPTASPSVETPETYILQVFGETNGLRAIKMLKECENKFMRTDALNWNGNGTYDYGLFQINSIHGYTKEQLADYKFNTRVAYKLFKASGYSFSQWTCSYVVGDKSFWQ